LGLSGLAARILVQRGHADPASARTFLRPDLADLHDPFLLTGMTEAVDRVLLAIARSEPVLLYGDYDVDGTTSVVILKKLFDLAGGNATYFVPHRLRDGYGMHPEVVRGAAEAGVRLIVSVDTGIRANEVVRLARELGVDVIVTDHHLPEAELPPALAVLNPNQPGCRYPEKNLCGAGVAFKLAQGVMARIGWAEARVGRLTESFLKMVAIATVADVVPLTGENRVIVKHGLDGLAATPNLGLRALLEVSGFGPGQAPTAGQVAFRVAPRINAAGRMASASDVIELFLTADAGRAKDLAKQLHDLNSDRQAAETAMVDHILALCGEAPVDDSRRGLVFGGEGWHRGVVGIVASRLVDRFHRPAFVLGIDPDKGVAQGSGRSAAGFHLLEALESMADLFLKFGGHRQAAGVTLPANRVDEFRVRFTAYANQLVAAEDLRATYHVDAEVEIGELAPSAVEEVFGLAPFGFGNPAPVLALRDVVVQGEPRVLKERHLRMLVRQGDRGQVVKAWNWATKAERLAAGSKVSMLVKLEPDDYAGFALTLEDVA
jgi:single-stranded-DNA-specific exonuclease